MIEGGGRWPQRANPKSRGRIQKKIKVLENVNPYTLLLALTSYAHPTYTLAQNVAEGYIEKLVI